MYYVYEALLPVIINQNIFHTDQASFATFRFVDLQCLREKTF
jgi:hypothetical protein